MNEGLFRNHLEKYRLANRLSKKAKVVSVSSGKGGVGKTFFTTNLAKVLVNNNKKVMLLDCDVYLSNCYLSLGVTPKKDIFDLIRGESIENCITRVDGIDLLSGRSGNENYSEENYVETILGVVQSFEYKYDYILLDCPAGIEKNVLSIISYSDERFLILNPNKYSLTDSYSLIKSLRVKSGVKEFSIVVNRCNMESDEKDISRRILNTCSSFLPDVKIKNLGRIPEVIRADYNGKVKSTVHDFLDNVFKSLNDMKQHGQGNVHRNKLETDFQLAF